MSTLTRQILAVLCCWSFSAGLAWAHKSSDSYLRVVAGSETVTGEWYLALHDLEFAIGLDANEDGDITWGELKARREAVLEYARSRLGLDAEGRSMDVRFRPELQVDQLANGGYAVLRWDAAWPTGRPGEALRLDYGVFFEANPLHRGLLVLEQGGKVHQAIFQPRETRLRFELDRPEARRVFLGFLREGVWHILIGYDHVLFLLVLLLPSVLVRVDGGWRVQEDFRGVLWNVVGLVTSFTVAHSITLSIAALGWVRLPSRLVESVIAASIVAAAANNLRPVVGHRAWIIAFGFGLIHGFGFASVLADLGLPRTNLVRALVGFNLGVEAGQLAIVLVFLPLAYALRRQGFYRVAVLAGGSWAAMLVAGFWLWERVTG